MPEQGRAGEEKRFERLCREGRPRHGPDPIPEDVLARPLAAAHRAPSVGFSQPWHLILVRDPKTRGRIAGLFGKAHRAEASLFDERHRAAYLSLKLNSLSIAP